MINSKFDIVTMLGLLLVTNVEMLSQAMVSYLAYLLVYIENKHYVTVCTLK